MDIQDIRKYLDRKQSYVDEQRNQWNTEMVHFRPIFEALKDETPIRLEYDSYGVGFYITGDKTTLAKWFKAFRAAGFKHQAKPPAENAPGWSAFWSHETVVGLQFYFSFESTVCRRVLVGKKQVVTEEDVYENICGNTDAADTELAAQTDDDIPF